MKNILLGSFTFLILGLLSVVVPKAFADELPSVGDLESQFQYQLTTRQETYDQPKATSYYDDLEDHYEQDQLMRDTIAVGLP